MAHTKFPKAVVKLILYFTSTSKNVVTTILLAISKAPTKVGENGTNWD